MRRRGVFSAQAPLQLTGEPGALLPLQGSCQDGVGWQHRLLAALRPARWRNSSESFWGLFPTPVRLGSGPSGSSCPPLPSGCQPVPLLGTSAPVKPPRCGTGSRGTVTVSGSFRSVGQPGGSGIIPRALARILEGCTDTLGRLQRSRIKASITALE